MKCSTWKRVLTWPCWHPNLGLLGSRIVLKDTVASPCYLFGWLWGHWISSKERSTWWRTEVSYQPIKNWTKGMWVCCVGCGCYKPSDDCSPSQHLGCSFLKDPEPESPTETELLPNFWDKCHRKSELIKLAFVVLSQKQTKQQKKNLIMIYISITQL